MKQTKFLLAAFVSLAVFAGCKKDAGLSQDNQATAELDKTNASLLPEAKNGSFTGHVYTLSNEAAGNKVLDYKRGSDGRLTFLASYATGGNGSGGGLGNQGAVIISNSGEELFAVNAGSNSISAFRVSDNGLRLKSTVSSGGIKPVSLTINDENLFVLNAGGNGNIAGFRTDDGRLASITNSSRPLGSTASGAAEVAFVNNGKVLAITEKATNKIITYTVSENGIPGGMHSITSANATPFGFAVGNNGNIFVSEAAGGAANASTVSSYHIGYNGDISLVTGPVATNQSAACWVVLSNNGKYAWTTNTASNTISTFDATNAGGLSLAASIAATTGTGPIDAALSRNSKFLYILNSMDHTISVYSVDSNGGLAAVQTVTGLVIGDNGLAAR
jgi:6-phosphogluconolactonase